MEPTNDQTSVIIANQQQPNQTKPRPNGIRGVKVNESKL